MLILYTITLRALSDVDNDGRLSCEEFVLAMYLCESAKAGNKLPTVLPAELIPPTNRRQRTSSIHSAGSGGTPVGEMMGSLADSKCIIPCVPHILFASSNLYCGSIEVYIFWA